MKRCLCLILALVMISAALPALAEEPFKPGEYAPRNLISDGERFYMVSDGTVYLCEKDGVPEPFMTGFPYDDSKAYRQPEYVNAMLADGDTLYGLNLNSGDLYAFALQKGEAREISHVKLDFSPLTVEEDGYSFTLYLNIVGIAGGKLWGTYSDYAVDRYPVISFDLSSGAAETYFPPQELSHLVPYRDGAFLATAYDQANAYDPATGEFALAPIGIWNPADNSFTELREYPFSYYDLGSMAYDPAGDTLYFYTPNRIYRMVSMGEIELCAYSPFSWLSAGGLQVAGNTAGLVGETGFVKRTLDPAMLPDQELIFYGNMNTAAHNKAVAAMGDIPVLESTQRLNWDDLGQAFVTGSIDADILCLPAGSVDIPRLLQKGYCAPLDGSTVVADYVDTLYPFFRDALEEGGTVYGVPAAIWAYGPAANSRELFDKIGQPIPETLEDVLDLIERWGAEKLYDAWPDDQIFMWMNGYRNSLISMALEMWGDHLTAEGLEWTLEDPQLRSLLQRIDAIDTSEWEIRIDWENDPNAGELEEEYMYRNALIEEAMDYGIQGLAEVGAMPLAMAEGMPACVGVDMYMLLINARSEHKEAALQYIENYIRAMEPIDLAMLQKDWSEPILNPHTQKNVADFEGEIARIEKAMETAEKIDVPQLQEELEMMEDNLAYAKAHSYWVTPEDIALWKQMMEHGFVKRPSMFYTKLDPEGNLRKLLNQYQDGLIGLDQFLSEGQRVIGLILRENQ